jgi:hypothetical protein
MEQVEASATCLNCCRASKWDTRAPSSRLVGGRSVARNMTFITTCLREHRCQAGQTGVRPILDVLCPLFVPPQVSDSQAHEDVRYCFLATRVELVVHLPNVHGCQHCGRAQAPVHWMHQLHPRLARRRDEVCPGLPKARYQVGAEIRHKCKRQGTALVGKRGAGGRTLPVSSSMHGKKEANDYRLDAASDNCRGAATAL